MSQPSPMTAPTRADPETPSAHDAALLEHDGCAGVCHRYSRRTVLRGAGSVTLGAAATLLAACAPTTGGSPSTGSAGAGSKGTTGSGAAAGGAVALAKLADVPVGGAIGVQGADGKPIILSQPVAGTVVGMSAVCTHAGCTVAPEGSELVCPCHGSVFTAADGKNVSGPAPKPLPAVAVRVEGDSIFAA
jgi:cytochrome b6-f complex iron-sulfur subunit